MAEFTEVFKAAKRMCALECKKCPLSVDSDRCGIRPWDKMEPDEVERIVMNWAKNHPEPVYPTWAELFYRELYQDFLIWCQEKYPGRAKDEKAWFDYIYETPIPADIAEKLGIEPKEANGDD